ncbi:MAG: bifunctional sulfate adenylyltransferase/adenylylsulfate kinase [Bdellovibrionales bacterium]|nr:bifunctional sulfate adenylyltransferase/adenylylsulfate kinase [Bdellovibrionales bacterium]
METTPSTNEKIGTHLSSENRLLVSPQRKRSLIAEAVTMESWTLSERQLCDLELLANQAFAPLSGFMTKEQYDSVCTEMRLPDGSIWPMPICLDVTREFAERLSIGQGLVLRDLENKPLAVIRIQSIWEPDKAIEAQEVFGTTSQDHPGVRALTEGTGEVYVGGSLEVLDLPTHYDFTGLRHTPHELRAEFEARGWDRIVAFQTRNPMHRAHFEITKKAAEEIGGKLLIHPIVGMTKPGDIDPFTRVRCYKALMHHYPSDTAMLSLLQLAMRMAGPREALWHALIRKNYGCTHFIVGRDHAGPGKDSAGNDFYDPYAAQELLLKYQDQIGIEMVPFKMMVYVKGVNLYKPIDQVDRSVPTLNISGTELRTLLKNGSEVPDWFTFPEVAKELRRTHKPRSSQGICIFFTGLPSSGKSTLANALRVKLQEIQDREITVLDGDIVRQNLSSELTFSEEHRNLNILRIGFVASEISKNGGIAICAPIAPYDSIRQKVREMVHEKAGFVLVHVATPLEICEERDVKGLYAKARAGVVKNFTGISDPYEIPREPDLQINTANSTPNEAVTQIITFLTQQGYLTPETTEVIENQDLEFA